VESEQAEPVVSAIGGKTKRDTRWLREELEGQRALLTPEQDLRLSNLYRHHRRLFVASFQLQERGEIALANDLSDDAASTPSLLYLASSASDVAHLQRRLKAITTINTHLADTANLLTVRRHYRHLVRVWLPLAGVITIASVVAFLLATTPQPDIRVSSPTTVQVTFNHDPSVLTSAGLPTSCAGLTISAVAVAGTFTQPVVVSDNTPRCTLNQVALNPQLATIVPVVPPDDDK